ncbi:MAG: UMP kinase [Saprospiraceae bacterium]|nr:UMP kinase [Saprospiraceae bacterium]
MSQPYKRVLLKLSGEALMGEDKYGISTQRIHQYTDEIKRAVECGLEIAIVIGGGNIYRGMNAEETGIERAQGDYMGMLATVINGMAIQSILENKGVQTRLMSSIEMKQICEPYIRRRAVRHLEKGRVIILAAGIGDPYFTTDTTSALRGVELNVDILLKGTRVDGIYTADPEKDATATKFDSLSFDDVYSKGLKVMDMTAFTLCRENNLPIVVFDMNEAGNLLKLIKGEKIGTLVAS